HASLELQGALPGLRAVLVLEVGDGERHTCRDAGARTDGRRTATVRLEQVVHRALGALAIVRLPRRVDAEQPAARAESLRLVDGAGKPDAVAESLGDAAAVAFEQLGKPFAGQAALLVQPAGEREVMERDQRHHAVAAAGVERAPVVSQSREGELAFRGLDAGPFDAEAKGVHAESR